jgi:hypothetical protein
MSRRKHSHRTKPSNKSPSPSSGEGWGGGEGLSSVGAVPPSLTLPRKGGGESALGEGRRP